MANHQDYNEAERQRRIHLLLDRLPIKVRNAVQWLLTPERRWIRIPIAIVFLIGGMLWFLPILGIWMLPVGIILLAEDVPLFRRLSASLLAWIERRHPSWLGLDKPAQ